MTKQMIKNIIILLIVTVLMGGLIGGTHALTAPIIKENEKRVLVNSAKENFEGSDVFFVATDELASEVLGEDKVEALSKEEIKELEGILFVYKGDEFQGITVVVSGSNGHGEVTLGVAINQDDLIAGLTIIKYDQTPGIGDGPRDKYLQEFKNKDFKYEVENVAGATNSSKLLGELVVEATTKYTEIKPILEKLVELDPIKEIFGTYTTEEDASFTPTEIISKKEIIKGTSNGVAYTGSKSYTFDEADGAIEMKVYVKDDGTIIYYEFLKYEHSKGAFQRRVIEFLDTFIGTKTDDITQTIADNKGLYANSSETVDNIIVPILLEIQEANKGPLAIAFGNYTIEEDATFTSTEIISKKELIEGDSNGFAYTGSKSYTFPVAKGEIELKFYMKDDGTIVYYEFLKYEHSKGAFQKRIIEFLDTFIGTKAENITQTIADNKGLYSRSTETAENIIVPILLAIETEVK